MSFALLSAVVLCVTQLSFAVLVSIARQRIIDGVNVEQCVGAGARTARVSNGRLERAADGVCAHDASARVLHQLSAGASALLLAVRTTVLCRLAACVTHLLLVVMMQATLVAFV